LRLLEDDRGFAVLEIKGYGFKLINESGWLCSLKLCAGLENVTHVVYPIQKRASV
jgi:hypothetical protein